MNEPLHAVWDVTDPAAPVLLWAGQACTAPAIDGTKYVAAPRGAIRQELAGAVRCTVLEVVRR